MFKQLALSTAAALSLTFTGGSLCVAQDDHGVPHQQTQIIQHQENHQYVNPGQEYHGPKIGIEAVTVGNMVQVTRTIWYTPASRLGLEPGDRILEINGHRVYSIQDLRRWLRDAEIYHNGQIRVLIDNVRARHGEFGAPRYVSQKTYLDGYAHLAGIESGDQAVVTYQQP